MQIHPLVTVKKAASVLGMDKETIRNMLLAGELMGERRLVGEKEKWFIYHGEVEDLLEKKRLPELMERAERTTLEGMNDFFVTDPLLEAELEPERQSEAELDTAELQAPTEQEHTAIEITQVHAERQADSDVALSGMMPAVDEILQSLTSEFARRLADEQQTIFKLEQELAEKDRMLRRIPDVEQRMQEETAIAEAKESEIRSLKLHIDALEQELSERRKPWWVQLFGGSKIA